MTIATLARSAALALVASSALAHPGHGTAPQNQMGFVEGLVHLLTQPDHLGMLLVAVGAAVVVARKVRASRRAASRRTGERS